MWPALLIPIITNGNSNMAIIVWQQLPANVANGKWRNGQPMTILILMANILNDRNDQY